MCFYGGQFEFCYETIEFVDDEDGAETGAPGLGQDGDCLQRVVSEGDGVRSRGGRFCRRSGEGGRVSERWEEKKGCMRTYLGADSFDYVYHDEGTIT